VFSQPKVFSQFAKDILNIELNINKVHTEYEYPEPVGFVQSKYDLFAEDVEQRVIVEILHIIVWYFSHHAKSMNKHQLPSVNGLNLLLIRLMAP